MSKIWTPPGAGPKHQCNVPGCGATFYDLDDYIPHVTKCVERNRGALLDLAEEHAAEEAENPLISGLPFDEEAMEFQRKRYGQQ
jgi:hypothetical protein